MLYRCAGTEISADTCATSNCNRRSTTLPRPRAGTKAHSYTDREDGGCPCGEEGPLSCGEAYTSTGREASSHYDRKTHSRSGREAVSH